MKGLHVYKYPITVIQKLVGWVIKCKNQTF